MDERILTEAARWHARLAAEDCTDVERAAFQRWRASDSRHAQASAAAERLSAQLARLGTFDSRLSAMADEAFAMGADENAPSAATVRTRRWAIPAALAATVVITFVGLRVSGYLAAPSHPETYAATEQSKRELTLADGSVVHLDVDSEIRVNYSASRRDITLVSGRALFEVARDATRPFVVTAGESTTTALGTHFQVQRDSEQVLVTLTEGAVAVAGETVHSSWREKLVPGEQMSVTDDGRLHVKRTIDSQVVTSWSRGRLVFRGTPLSEALQEVNRYGSRKVILGDSDLADLPVAGNFIAGETDLIVSAFAAVLPLRVADGSAGEIILFRRYMADGS